MHEWLNNDVSLSGFYSNPQDSLGESNKDITSIYGNADNNFLSGINVMHSNENTQTPFSYNAFMKDIIETPDNKNNMAEYYYDDEDEDVPTLSYES